MDTHDISTVALCLWREARGEGNIGMQAVACVIKNRVMLRKTDYHTEVYRKWAFTSMSDPRDHEFNLQPTAADLQYQYALMLASRLDQSSWSDITDGATLYYAFRTMSWPHDWNPALCVHTVDIGNHKFYREVH